MMIDNRVNVAKKLRETPEKLAKENFYDDASYKIEPLLFEMVYDKPLTSKLETNIVCGNNSIT